MIAATVSGNLGKAAEMRDAGGHSVCSFGIASNTKIKGEKKTTWVQASLWGKRGETLCQYLTTGTKVVAVGELSIREHNGKTYLELRVSEIDLLGGGERGSGSGSAPAPRSESSAAPSNEYGDADYGDSGGDDDDIPF